MSDRWQQQTKLNRALSVHPAYGEDYSLHRHMTTLFGEEPVQNETQTTIQKVVFELKRIFSGLTYLLVPGIA